MKPKFTLRTLLITCSMLGLFFALLAVRHERYRRSEAVAKLLWCGTDSLPKRVPLGAPIQSNVEALLLGDNSYAFIETVEGSNQQLSKKRIVSAHDLSALQFMPRIKHLILNYSTVDDAGIDHIRNLHSIELLALSDTNITDKSLEIIGSLPKLEKLSLGKTVVTDKGIASLRKLTNLLSLDLEDTHVTGSCLRYFAGMKRLKGLYLSGTQITDKELSNLEMIPSLELLELARTPIEGKNLESLAKIKNLQWLDLSETLLNDESAPLLLAFNRPMSIKLYGTRISHELQNTIKDQLINTGVESDK